MKDWALAAWLLTAVVGLWLLAAWARLGGWSQERRLHDAALRRGREPHRSAAEPVHQLRGLSSTSIVLHALMAVIGVAVWAAYVGTRSDNAGAGAAVACVLLAAAVALGLYMFVRWWGDRRSRGPVAAELDEAPVDRDLPPAVVYLHGALAALTLVLVVATVVGGV